MNLVRPAVLLSVLMSAAAGHAQTPLRVRVHASGFSLPVAFVQDPTDPRVQFVVEQGGRIRSVRDGIALSPDFLDLRSAVSSGGEQGLLGLAFSPDYPTSRRFFVNFTDTAGNTVIARFRRSAANPLLADSSSRFDLRWGGASGPSFIAQPFSNHNGGHLAFGPDGFLYIGLGDGGAGDDPGHRAQTGSELLGKMLRIDVNVPDSNPSGYQVPPDNPFVGSGPAGTRPEIWSFGLRNPWRYNFDDPIRGGTGALVIADVGQSQWEEIDYEPPSRGGRNYGWRNREGTHDHVTSLPPAFLPLVDPIHEYDHGTGQSVTGGFVYRGSVLGAAYRGRYFFADFIAGRVWSLSLDINPTTGEASASRLIEHTAELGGNAQLGNISSFGLDGDGELYIVSYSLGRILKVLPALARDGDFDGDGVADITVFRPSSGAWYVLGSNTSAGLTWGGVGDIPVPGDYDGDGKTDIAVFRPSTGTWYILRSRTATGVAYTWGVSTDIPVPGDYDGDGKTDIAVFRPSTGAWYILRSQTATGIVYTWGVSTDRPAPADYDGDGKTDIAIYRPSTETWYILQSGTSSGRTSTWGGPSDTPVPGDYDGDGKADIAVFRPSTDTWYILRSATSTGVAYLWGTNTDTPVPGDYDGDGKTDVAVFRPSTGIWYILRSRSMTGAAFAWGVSTDVPILKRP